MNERQRKRDAEVLAELKRREKNRIPSDLQKYWSVVSVGDTMKVANKCYLGVDWRGSTKGDLYESIKLRLYPEFDRDKFIRSMNLLTTTINKHRTEIRELLKGL